MNEGGLMLLGSPSVDTAPGLFLVLLIAGHVFADFLVQTSRIAEGKGGRFATLLQHGFMTFLTHLIFVIPFWSVTIGAAILALSVAHTLLDYVKGRLGHGGQGSLLLFVVDQALHVAILLIVWRVILRFDFVGAPLINLEPLAMARLAAWTAVAAGLVFNGRGGATLVRLVLERFPEMIQQGDPNYRMGRVIGILERLIVFILVLLGQWGALGLVLAAKSIARYNKLSEQRFADYYLIGTLTSLLVAIITGELVRIFLI